MAPAKVEVKVRPNEISILIKGLPHLLLRRHDLSGIQAYWKTTGVLGGALFFIEFTTSNGVITSDYNDRALWESILVAIRDANMFDRMLGESRLPGSA